MQLSVQPVSVPVASAGVPAEASARPPWMVVLWPLLACLAGIIVLQTLMDAESTSHEDGPLECVQAGLWGVSALAAAWAVWAAPRGARLFPAWLMAGAILCGLREFDAHEWLTPQHLGEWGVHFKIKWVLDFGVPLWVKLFWAGVWVAFLVVVFWPLWRLRGPVFAALGRLEPALVLLAVCAVLLLIGYLADDQFGRDRFVPSSYTQVLEEDSETLGAVAYLAALWWVRKRNPVRG